ncbi:MAG: hypothetical protein IH606_23645 [Burkholderiales bacterium]|nr:hypothetical protein [Burkholderiales bacterium]
MRLLAFIQFTTVMIGIIAAIAGHFFALPKGVHLGVGLVGAGIALGGLESIVTRRMCFRAWDDKYEAYAGTPALIAGFMALLVGTVLVAAAYVLTEGLWNSTLNYLMRRPAPVLIAAGSLLLGAGVLMMLNPQGRSGLAWMLLVRVPRSLLGFLVVLGGLAGIGLGAWEWLEPVAFDRFVKNLPQQFSWPIAPKRR